MVAGGGEDHTPVGADGYVRACDATEGFRSSQWEHNRWESYLLL